MTDFNDRQTPHSAVVPLSNFRTDGDNRGTTRTTDPMSGRPETANEPGHPIRHILTNNIPSSSCMVCHIHPGTNMVATYYGMTWWDNETDGKQMYPDKVKKQYSVPLYQVSDPEADRKKPEAPKKK